MAAAAAAATDPARPAAAPPAGPPGSDVCRGGASRGRWGGYGAPWRSGGRGGGGDVTPRWHRPRDCPGPPKPPSPGPLDPPRAPQPRGTGPSPLLSAGTPGPGALPRGRGERPPRNRHRHGPAGGRSGGTGPGLPGAAVPLRAVRGAGGSSSRAPPGTGGGEPGAGDRGRGTGSGAAPPLPAGPERAPDPRRRAMAAPRRVGTGRAPG